MGVSDSSKLQIQKQITTGMCRQSLTTPVFPIVQSYKFKSKSQPLMGGISSAAGCFRQFKVTNSKANHNRVSFFLTQILGVSDSSKLQIQKQITTEPASPDSPNRCFRQFKVTNSKANHNSMTRPVNSVQGVSDSSKLQIQKQITTS